MRNDRGLSSTNDSIVAAVVQMSSGNDWESNFSEAEKSIRVAAEQGAQLVVLPENCLCFSQSSTAAFSSHVQFYLQKFFTLAKELSVSLVAGSVPIDSNIHSRVVGELDSTKYFSRSYIFSSNTSDVANALFYDKVHLFDVDVDDGVGSYRESDSFLPGVSATLAPVLGRKLGLSICYDVRFPELYQHYMLNGADMLSVPAAFTYATGEKHWELLLRARAIETQCFVLAANQCGEHAKGRFTWGHSMIVAPNGDILVEAGHSPGVFMAELDFVDMEVLRQRMPLLHHKRLT